VYNTLFQEEYFMEQFKDYYAILDVEENAFPSQIKNAYLSQVRLCHPDHDKSEGARERFAVANEAYFVLINPISRSKYDQIYEYYKHSENEVFLKEKQKRKIEASVSRRVGKGDKKAIKRGHQSVENIDSFFKGIDFIFHLLDLIFNLFAN
jgi:curved DNA-binding protein CbpA